MDPLVTASLLQGGAGLLESLFGQDDPYEEYRMAGLDFSKSRLGKDTINFADLLAKNRSRSARFANEYGEDINKRFGLNTGRGQQELLKFGFDKERDFELDQYPQLALANEGIKQGYARNLTRA